MDWFPLWNSLRIALVSTAITFFLGICTAHYIAKLPRIVKGTLDCILTIPLVLPPTVVGFLILKVLGPRGAVGRWVLDWFGVRITMTWYAAVFAVVAVTFPLMYRTARGAFEALDPSLIHAGQTLGCSNTYIFWRIIMPCCKTGILAGTVLTFARGLGAYGATSMVSGYIQGQTATVSTTVYQAYRQNEDALAYLWIAVNLAISFCVMVAVNMMEKRAAKGREVMGHGAFGTHPKAAGQLPARCVLSGRK